MAVTALMEVATEPIDANQCHFGVGEIDTATIAYCKEHGIALESYGTLHGGVPMDDPRVAAVAARHKVSTVSPCATNLRAGGCALSTASNGVLVIPGSDHAQIRLAGTHSMSLPPN